MKIKRGPTHDLERKVVKGGFYGVSSHIPGSDPRKPSIPFHIYPDIRPLHNGGEKETGLYVAVPRSQTKSGGKFKIGKMDYLKFLHEEGKPAIVTGDKYCYGLCAYDQSGSVHFFLHLGLEQKENPYKRVSKKTKDPILEMVIGKNTKQPKIHRGDLVRSVLTYLESGYQKLDEYEDLVDTHDLMAETDNPDEKKRLCRKACEITDKLHHLSRIAYVECDEKDMDMLCYLLRAPKKPRPDDPGYDGISYYAIDFNVTGDRKTREELLSNSKGELSQNLAGRTFKFEPTDLSRSKALHAIRGRTKLSIRR